MEVKPSFFSLAGFLAPGLISVFAFSAVWGASNPHSLSTALAYLELHKIEGAAGVVAGAVAIAFSLTAAFVVGCVLSETFIYFGRALILRRLLRRRRNSHFSRLLSKPTLDTLLDGDLNAREAYVYTQTCGLDLHWYAGRVRMIGGSGVGLLGVAVYDYLHGCSGSAQVLLITSIIFLSVAIYRSHKFDEYVAATAAVLRFAPPRKKDDE